jgi:predicted secreted acid phosphatase
MRPHRLLLALAATLALLPAAVAQAGTTRTDTPADTLKQQVDSGAYAKSVAAAFAKAQNVLKAQLKHKPKKPAIVLDIDETALSNMKCLEDADFELIGLGVCVAGGLSEKVPGADALIKLAQRNKVAVFFVTGAPEVLCDSRAANLRKQGVSGHIDITCKPADDTDDSLVPYKSGARADIEKQGYTIVLNVGDQKSDLAGGHAQKTVLVPNPVYVTT